MNGILRKKKAKRVTK